jgi:hypothetical protein
MMLKVNEQAPFSRLWRREATRNPLMLADLLHLSRNLRRSPASAVAAVLTLSLTLGAGASIFAVVDAVLLTPPPFTSPNALVTVGETPLDEPAAAPRAVSFATFEAWRERAGGLATIEAFDGTNRCSSCPEVPSAYLGAALEDLERNAQTGRVADWSRPGGGRLIVDLGGSGAQQRAVRDCSF